jgi:glycosyl transferase family 4/glycosyl transferase family 1
MKNTGGQSRSLRILIVTHAFPPMNSIASHRPYSWARFWRDEGHEVHVLTPSKHPFDGTMDLERDMHGIHVHEVGYLPLRASRPRTDPVLCSEVGRWEWLKTITRRARFSLAMFGDPRLFAYLPMVRAGMKMMKQARMDFIIATSPPEVVFFVARTLSLRSGVPWIADFRDLWFRDMRLYQSRFASWLSGPVNWWLVKNATALITVSQGLRDRLSSYLGREVAVSYNGFFKCDQDRGVVVRSRTDTHLHIVYTGRLYPGKRDPEPLFRAIKALKTRRADLVSRLVVDFYGFDDPWLRQLIATHGLESTVMLHGFVPYSQSMAAQQSADVLLFLDWTETQADGVLTGKLFEYLGAGKPILSLGRRKDSEAAHLIADSACGVTLTTDDEILDYLLNLAIARSRYADSDKRNVFSREWQARLLLQTIRTQILGQAGLNHSESELTISQCYSKE